MTQNKIPTDEEIFWQWTEPLLGDPPTPIHDCSFTRKDLLSLIAQARAAGREEQKREMLKSITVIGEDWRNDGQYQKLYAVEYLLYYFRDVAIRAQGEGE